MIKARGFTLVEMVLAIAITGIMAMIWVPGLTSVFQGFDLLTVRRQVLAESRAGMDLMVREIRLIPSSSSITAVSATSFTFQYPAGTSIVYALSGTNLQRNSVTLIGNVSSLAFTYYDELGVATTTASAVRSVQIQFTVASPNSQPSYTLRTRVFITNTGNRYANFTSP